MLVSWVAGQIALFILFLVDRFILTLLVFDEELVGGEVVRLDTAVQSLNVLRVDQVSVTGEIALCRPILNLHWDLHGLSELPIEVLSSVDLVSLDRAHDLALVEHPLLHLNQSFAKIYILGHHL